MDKLFEDDIELFCVDIVLNHFGCLEKRETPHGTFKRFLKCQTKKYKKLWRQVVSHMLLSWFPDLARNYEPGPRFPCKATSTWRGGKKVVSHNRDRNFNNGFEKKDIGFNALVLDL